MKSFFRVSWPEVVLYLMTSSSGALDVLSYSKLGGVFASAMTGNIALVAYSAFTNHFETFQSSCVSLLAFGIGAVSGSYISEFFKNGIGSRILAIFETIVLFVFALIVQPHLHSLVSNTILIAFASFGMGLQVIRARMINLVGISTIVFTTNLTNLLSGITKRPLPKDIKYHLKTICTYVLGGITSSWLCAKDLSFAAFLPCIMITITLLRLNKPDESEDH